MDRRTFNKSSLFWAIGAGLSTFAGTGRAHPGHNDDIDFLVPHKHPEPAPLPPKPNILFCIADDMGLVRGDWLKMPAFDRVAKDGILFQRAYTPNAKCSPSRACILTGRNSWQLEEAANHSPFFPQKFKTYPEALIEHGYHVGYTGKGWAPGEPGKDAKGKRRQLCGKSYNEKTLKSPTKSISDRDYAENFRAFLDDRKEGQLFCFWYGGHEPHRPYTPGSGEKAGKKTSDIKDVYDFWPDNKTVRADMLDYSVEVEWFDTHLQKMLSILEEKGELDNTLVIVTSDNGMPFPRVKGDCYERSNHLPFAAMWKNGIKNPGRSVEDFVSFIDIAPTFLEVAQVPQEKSGMQPITGRSLTDIMLSEKKFPLVNRLRDHVLIGKERHDVGLPDDVGYPVRGIVKGPYMLIVNFAPDRWPMGAPETGYTNTDGGPTKTEVLDSREKPETKKFWEMCFDKRGSEELYNVVEDPDCMNNLAGKSEFAALQKQLKDMLFYRLKAENDPRMFGKGDVFDKYPYSNPAVKDYYNRYMKGEKVKAGWINESDYRPIK